jgi:hypothetical protein
MMMIHTPRELMTCSGMRCGVLLVRAALELGSVANESEVRGPREGEGV